MPREVFISLTLIIFAVLLTSCRKDNSLVQDEDELNTNQCVPLPPEYHEVIGWMTFQSELPRQLRPCFNPTNSNEIVFQEDSESGTSSVYKFNLINKEKTFLAEGPVVSQPSWGVNDWILLVFYDFNVWRIRPDGTDLERITEGGGFYSPKWNADGTRFVTNLPFQPDFSLVHDVNGEITDTLMFDVRHSYTLEKDPYIVVHHQSLYRVYDRSVNDIVSEYQFQSFWGGGGSGSVFWKDDYSLVFSNPDGIHSADYGYQQLCRLVDACNSVSYLHGDINSEKTQMIWSHSQREYIGSATVKIKTKLQLMDVNGNVLMDDVLED